MFNAVRIRFSRAISRTGEPQVHAGAENQAPPSCNILTIPKAPEPIKDGTLAFLRSLSHEEIMALEHWTCSKPVNLAQAKALHQVVVEEKAAARVDQFGAFEYFSRRGHPLNCGKDGKMVINLTGARTEGGALTYLRHIEKRIDAIDLQCAALLKLIQHLETQKKKSVFSMPSEFAVTSPVTLHLSPFAGTSTTQT